ncbi:MAG: Ni/Fe-hydrogenase cytochrome b subunit [Ignavibacteria bacterium]|nr:Ni/Fe-hydrogenase cytochrome b subunit [Ignavibacteria bacterium]
MKQAWKRRYSFWSLTAAVLIVIGLVGVIQRYAFGLGETTNLSDRFPWGLWIGFDILVGVGLAAGGFTIAAAVHIFNIERFRPILKPTILTAFLGYLLVIAGLLVDLGKPWAIWHALIYWNTSSVMFEVAWCVMLYTVVLALEFSPVVLERFNLQAPLRVIRAITIPVVVTGVILSTLHQSSLGSLFIIIPGRMHPLWYSTILPFLFLISSIAAGLAMTIVESQLSAKAFGRKIEVPLLADLARVVVVVLATFLAVRVQDLINRDALRFALEPTYQSGLFWVEIVLGTFVPIALLLIPRFRHTANGLFNASVLVLLGFVANRLNTAITSMEQWPDRTYMPSWQEVAITLGLAAVGFALFSAGVRYLNVFGPQEDPGARQRQEVLSQGSRTTSRRTDTVCAEASSHI